MPMSADEIRIHIVIKLQNAGEDGGLFCAGYKKALQDLLYEIKEKD